MTLVYLAIALWGVVIVNGVARRVADAIGRRLPTDADRYCSSADARLDELAARRALHPTGSCEVIQFPRRGDAA